MRIWIQNRHHYILSSMHCLSLVSNFGFTAYYQLTVVCHFIRKCLDQCPFRAWIFSWDLQSNGGGWVPLSRAICCRPCLPKEIPGTTEATAVAIISTGCHPSSNRGPDVLQCESSGGSFITGEIWLYHTPWWYLFTNHAENVACYSLFFLQGRIIFLQIMLGLLILEWYSYLEIWCRVSRLNKICTWLGDIAWAASFILYFFLVLPYLGWICLGQCLLADGAFKSSYQTLRNRQVVVIEDILDSQLVFPSQTELRWQMLIVSRMATIHNMSILGKLEGQIMRN